MSSSTAVDPSTLALQVEDLRFNYSSIAAPDGPAVLEHVNLNLPKGSRCILVGANGAGESGVRWRDCGGAGEVAGGREELPIEPDLLRMGRGQQQGGRRAVAGGKRRYTVEPALYEDSVRSATAEATGHRLIERTSADRQLLLPAIPPLHQPAVQSRSFS